MKLAPAKPDDLYARMDLVVDAETMVVIRDSDGEPGWIEFWSHDAKNVQAPLKRVEAALYSLQTRPVPPTGRSVAESQKYLDDLRGLMIDGLALRVKAWRLVSDGEAVDYPLTLETAKQLFDEPEHDGLLTAALNFVKDKTNFTMRASTNS